MLRRKPVTEQGGLPRVECHFAGGYVRASFRRARRRELNLANLRAAADDAGSSASRHPALCTRDLATVSDGRSPKKGLVFRGKTTEFSNAVFAHDVCDFT